MSLTIGTLSISARANGSSTLALISASKTTGSGPFTLALAEART